MEVSNFIYSKIEYGETITMVAFPSRTDWSKLKILDKTLFSTRFKTTTALPAVVIFCPFSVVISNFCNSIEKNFFIPYSNVLKNE